MAWVVNIIWSSWKGVCKAFFIYQSSLKKKKREQQAALQIESNKGSELWSICFPLVKFPHRSLSCNGGHASGIYQIFTMSHACHFALHRKKQGPVSYHPRNHKPSLVEALLSRIRTNHKAQFPPSCLQQLVPVTWIYILEFEAINASKNLAIGRGAGGQGGFWLNLVRIYPKACGAK